MKDMTGVIDGNEDRNNVNNSRQALNEMVTVFSFSMIQRDKDDCHTRRMVPIIWEYYYYMTIK